MENLLERLNFRDGLIPALIVDAGDGQVLTLCYMDREALSRTLSTGKIHLFRRSKGRIMLKGQTSGHVQKVRQIRIDCEGNSLQFLVEQAVGACHKGYKSCYFTKYDPQSDSFQVTEERVFEPDAVYGDA